MKKHFKIFCAAAGIYLLLIVLLLLAEKNAGGKNALPAEGGIKTLGDAIWFSLVTMTTVGYGDVYPVTAVGKMIGCVFLLLSLGFLAFIISTVMSLIAGRWVPELLLRMNSKRPWYIFSQRNAAAEALAADLSAHHPDAVMVFCKTAAKISRNKIFLTADVQALSELSCFANAERTVFLIAPEAARNRAGAACLAGKGIRIFCRSAETEKMPEVSFFDERESCARLYWQQHPLTEKERSVVLIGSGSYAQALLNQAVIVNCMTPFRTVNYHLFGDWKEYQQFHPCLLWAFGSEPDAEDKDSLIFHDSPWNMEQLEAADRIILCDDDFDANAETVSGMNRWFSGMASVYVLSSDTTLPGIGIGRLAALFSEETVLKQSQDRAARTMHESYCRSVGGGPAWETLSSFMKASNRAVADHTRVKKLILSENHLDLSHLDAAVTEKLSRNEHDRWLRFHYLYNWSYAPVRNNALRRHPCLVPYDQLSRKDKDKDFLAWKQLNAEKEESGS